MESHRGLNPRPLHRKIANEGRSGPPLAGFLLYLENLHACKPICPFPPPRRTGAIYASCTSHSGALWSCGNTRLFWSASLPGPARLGSARQAPVSQRHAEEAGTLTACRVSGGVTGALALQKHKLLTPPPRPWAPPWAPTCCLRITGRRTGLCLCGE